MQTFLDQQRQPGHHSFNTNTNRSRQTETHRHVTIGRQTNFLRTTETDSQVTTVLTVKDADRQFLVTTEINFQITQF